MSGKEPKAKGRFIFTAAALVVVAYGLRWAQPVLMPLLLAAFLAVLIAPAVQWLARFRIPRVLAVILVAVALGVVLLTFVAVVGGSVNQFIEAVPRYQKRVDVWGQDALVRLEDFGVTSSALSELDFVSPSAIMGFLGTSLKGIGKVASSLFLVLLVLVFMLLEAAGLPAKLRASTANGESVMERFQAVTISVRAYLGVKTAMSLGTGLCAGAWTAVLGIDFPVVWGLVAFLLNYIPTIGSIIAAVPVVLLSLLSHGPGTALAVAIGYLIINIMFGNVIEPNLQGRALGLSALSVILSLVFWGWLWGTVGALLSVPLTMVIKIACEQSPHTRWLAVMLGSPKAVGEPDPAVAAAADDG